MTFGIMNSSGNVLEWFDDASSAQAALAEMLGEYPDADLVVLAFDEAGNLVRDNAKAKFVVEAATVSRHAEGVRPRDRACVAVHEL